MFYDISMSSPQFTSFKDVADVFLAPEHPMSNAWPDIQCVCMPRPEGVKKGQQEVNVNSALERVIATLQKKYTSSSDFKASIQSFSLDPSSGMTQQALYHFADKWEQYERQAATIGAKRSETAVEVNDMLIHHTHRTKPLNREETAQLRERKKQRRESKMRQANGHSGEA